LKTRASNLRTRSRSLRSKRLRFFLKLSKQRDRFFCGNAKFSSKKTCKIHSIRLLARLRSSLCAKKSTRWSFVTTPFENNKKKWLKIWNVLYSNERLF